MSMFQIFILFFTES